MTTLHTPKGLWGPSHCTAALQLLFGLFPDVVEATYQNTQHPAHALIMSAKDSKGAFPSGFPISQILCCPAQNPLSFFLRLLDTYYRNVLPCFLLRCKTTWLCPECRQVDEEVADKLTLDFTSRDPDITNLCRNLANPPKLHSAEKTCRWCQKEATLDYFITHQCVESTQYIIVHIQLDPSDLTRLGGGNPVTFAGCDWKVVAVLYRCEDPNTYGCYIKSGKKWFDCVGMEVTRLGNGFGPPMNNAIAVVFKKLDPVEEEEKRKHKLERATGKRNKRITLTSE